MKHTSNKQEFLVIGRATIESSSKKDRVLSRIPSTTIESKRTPRQRTIKNIMKGIIIHL